ncbi:uncharacterized protein LOC123967748 isoform X2 [Micropterus dolomieu]|uniref:uncharacterized protein LOC123967748 isoform X2 n=1 Tax=Micropterus dolomieu TaxID=147949 RepID=UPI001E8DF244|nr:uncharacterized protein LOC123967748 isoform X2 [Micropterus dolomieu]
MDKEAEIMDKISSSPVFSLNSETAEITNIPVSGTNHQTAEDLDDLMHCDDVLDKEELTCPCTHPIISEDSISTCTSVWSSMDKDSISTNSSSWFYINENGGMNDSKNMETETDDFEENWTTEEESTSRLSVRSDESGRSSCAIIEASKMLVSHIINEAGKILQSTETVETLQQSTEAIKTQQCTEADRILQSTEDAKTLQTTEAGQLLQQSTEDAKTLQTTEAGKLLQQSTEDAKTLQTTEAGQLLQQSTEDAKTLQTTEAGQLLQQSTEDAKTLQTTEAGQLLQQSTEETKTLQTTEAGQLLQQFTEDAKILKITEAGKLLQQSTEDAKTLQTTEAGKLLQQSTEDAKILKITEAGQLLQQSTEDAKTLQTIEAGKLLQQSTEAVKTQLFLNSSTIAVYLRRFFQSLTAEQWREVSEGVYNIDVKEQLTDMCTDVLRFISESVTKQVLQAIHQDQSSNNDTMTLRSPLSSAPLIDSLGITEYNMQRSLESSFSQALCDVFGTDTTGRISPKFTEAIAGEVINEINSVLSVAIQVSLDRSCHSVTAAACDQVTNDRAAKKTLEGAISTMKSFLTGQGTAMRRRIQTDKVSDFDSKEVTPASGCKGKRKKSQWKRCFSGWQRKKIQAVPLDQEEMSSSFPHQSINSGDEDEEIFRQSSVDSSRPFMETEAKKSNSFLGFFHNLFSKNEKKAKKEEKKTERSPFWKRLLCRSADDDLTCGDRDQFQQLAL